MTQIVLILLLVLLIIIALNYKKIKYTKTYKKCLSRIRDFIDSQTKSKKKSKIKSKNKSKHNKSEIIKEQDITNDNITISDVLDDSNKVNDDNISLLSDISTIDMNSLDSKDSKKELESVLSFD
jgi:predicted Holliday junction resolvase-like endonuclease